MWRKQPSDAAWTHTMRLAEEGGFCASVCGESLLVLDAARGRFFRTPVLGVTRVTARQGSGAELVVQVGARMHVLDELPMHFASAAADAVARILPSVTPHEVTAEDVQNAAGTLHGKVIQVRGRHDLPDGGSTFLSAALIVPRDLTVRPRGGLVLVTGLFMHEGAATPTLLAYRYAPLG